VICPEQCFEAIGCSIGNRRGSGIGWSAHWPVLYTLHVWIWKKNPAGADRARSAILPESILLKNPLI
jgi:hypothetical protein